MKTKSITWNPRTDYPDVISGIVNNQELFTITKETKRNIHVLSSWAIKSETFNNSSSPKRLGEYPTVEEAQNHAQNKFDQYVNSLIETEVEIPA